jgi:hypothetical protein
MWKFLSDSFKIAFALEAEFGEKKGPPATHTKAGPGG